MRLPGTKTVCVPEDAARAFEQATHPIMVDGKPYLPQMGPPATADGQVWRFVYLLPLRK